MGMLLAASVAAESEAIELEESADACPGPHEQSPITCSAEDSLAEAARLMWERDCGSVMVTEPNGRLVGIITDRDICMAAYTRGKGSAKCAWPT